MLSYQHGYHAGNFADVFKHTVLTRLLNYLTIKEKPLFYLDTHSGKGRYHLYDKQALKTSEFLTGVTLLWEKRHHLPPDFKSYISCLESLNTTEGLQYYPGSPDIAIQLLRTNDRLFLCEKHPSEFQALKQLPSLGRRVFSSQSDGVAQLQAQLPPMEHRGLIFIDPSYEIKTEYRQIPQAIKSAYKRFSNGMFCLWYPIVDNKLHDQLLRELNQIGAQDYICSEFHLTKDQSLGMRGCGLWIINPPFTLQDEMDNILKTLCTLFNPGGSTYLRR